MHIKSEIHPVGDVPDFAVGECFGDENLENSNVELNNDSLEVKTVKPFVCITKKKQKQLENEKLHSELMKSRVKSKTRLQNVQNDFKSKLPVDVVTRKKSYTKFILPSRSIHSSRVIKPNKRFIDNDKNSKLKIHTPLCNNDKNVTKENNSVDALSSNVKKITPSELKRKTNNGNATPDAKKSRIILREARLNIKTDTIKEGPFSATYNLSSVKEGKI